MLRVWVGRDVFSGGWPRRRALEPYVAESVGILDLARRRRLISLVWFVSAQRQRPHVGRATGSVGGARGFGSGRGIPGSGLARPTRGQALFFPYKTRGARWVTQFAALAPRPACSLRRFRLRPFFKVPSDRKGDREWLPTTWTPRGRRGRSTRTATTAAAPRRPARPRRPGRRGGGGPGQPRRRPAPPTGTATGQPTSVSAPRPPTPAHSSAGSTAPTPRAGTPLPRPRPTTRRRPRPPAPSRRSDASVSRVNGEPNKGTNPQHIPCHKKGSLFVPPLM